MQTSIPTSPDFFFLLLYVFLGLIFLFQAYFNFVRKELSKFSLDAFSLFLATAFSGRQSQQRIKSMSRDSKRIRIFGVYALLGVAGSIYEIAKWFQEFYPN